MRDPKRIDRMIEKLRAAWWSAPDQRLGQLVVNLCRHEDMSEAALDAMNARAKATR